MLFAKYSAILSLSVAIAAGVVGAASAESVTQMARRAQASGSQMREGQHTLAPFAFIRYCVASPGACRPSDVRKIEWSAEMRAMIDKVIRRVNRQIVPTNESADVWSADVAKGDCEDFALTKRHALIEAGLPASALRIAVARTAGGEGHAVLVVKTDSGDFVLDNRTSRMLGWNQTDLTWLKIASAEDPRLWRRVI